MCIAGELTKSVLHIDIPKEYLNLGKSAHNVSRGGSINAMLVSSFAIDVEPAHYRQNYDVKKGEKKCKQHRDSRFKIGGKV